jgi:hypothetical protein
MDKALTDAMYYLLTFASIYFVAYFRPFYVIPHLLQYWRSNHTRNPFILFNHSPIYWDQMIYTPLPLLQDWLVNLVHHDYEHGINEIFLLFVSDLFSVWQHLRHW